jgi:hypothetical protein
MYHVSLIDVTQSALLTTTCPRQARGRWSLLGSALALALASTARATTASATTTRSGLPPPGLDLTSA